MVDAVAAVPVFESVVIVGGVATFADELLTDVVVVVSVALVVLAKLVVGLSVVKLIWACNTFSSA